MNAISLLKADHREVERLFGELSRLNGKTRGKKSLCEKIVRQLSIHSAIEEQFFYPEVRKNVPDLARRVLESLEAHSVVKWTLSAIASMDADDERLDAKLKVLEDTMMRHVREEEDELFPKVQQALSRAQLDEMGKKLERAKKTAPTRPHPRVPNQPPANIVLGMGAGIVDRARDAGRAVLRGARTHRTGRVSRPKHAVKHARAMTRA